MTPIRIFAATMLFTLSGCKHAPNDTIPDFQNTADLRIELSRSSCFGPCPQYDLTIFGNGNIEFCGGIHVEKPGLHSGAISSVDVQKLYAAIIELEFFDMESQHADGVLHASTNIVTVSNGDNTKIVSERTDWMDRNRNIHVIQEVIDKAANSSQWIGNTPVDFPDKSASPTPDCLKPQNQ